MIGGPGYFGHVVVTGDGIPYDHAKRSVTPYGPLDKLEMEFVMGQE